MCKIENATVKCMTRTLQEGIRRQGKVLHGLSLYTRVLRRMQSESFSCAEKCYGWKYELYHVRLQALASKCILIKLSRSSRTAKPEGHTICSLLLWPRNNSSCGQQACCVVSSHDQFDASTRKACSGGFSRKRPLVFRRLFGIAVRCWQADYPRNMLRQIKAKGGGG